MIKIVYTFFDLAFWSYHRYTDNIFKKIEILDGDKACAINLIAVIKYIYLGCTCSVASIAQQVEH